MGAFGKQKRSQTPNMKTMITFTNMRILVSSALTCGKLKAVQFLTISSLLTTKLKPTISRPNGKRLARKKKLGRKRRMTRRVQRIKKRGRKKILKMTTTMKMQRTRRRQKRCEDPAILFTVDSLALAAAIAAVPANIVNLHI